MKGDREGAKGRRETRRRPQTETAAEAQWVEVQELNRSSHALWFIAFRVLRICPTPSRLRGRLLPGTLYRPRVAHERQPAAIGGPRGDVDRALAAVEVGDHARWAAGDRHKAERH